jgi:glycosyltransferase involved in cell wall biosynthesis
MDISIIMPVYNSEEYLRKAIDSVLNQDYDSFELVLVDDGSTDGSGKICDEYAEKNSNVKVIHKENGGICTARNAGLEAAKGEYVGFCDNDDEYLPGLIRDNVVYAKEHNVDLMRYAKIKHLERDDGKVWVTVAKIEDMCIEKSEFPKYYNNIRREDTIWTAIYKKSIIDEHGIRFDTNFRHGSEDMNFNLQFLKYCEILGFKSKAYYSWTQRDSHSTSRKFNKDFLSEILVNLQLEYEFMSGVCENRLDEKSKYLLLLNTYVHTMTDYMDNKGDDLSMKERCKYLDDMRNHPIFDKEIPKTALKEIKKDSYRQYISLKLFGQRRYRTLIIMLKIGTRVLAKFRFK